MKVAFDIDLMRPGCPLVAIGLGACPKAANRFDIDDWLLFPTDGMKVRETTESQLETLISMVRPAT